MPDRVQVGAGRGEPATAVQVAVEAGEPLLPVAVDVVGERVAGLLGRLEERREERVLGRPRSSTSGPSPPRQSSAPAMQVSIRLKYGRQWA